MHTPLEELVCLRSTISMSGSGSLLCVVKAHTNQASQGAALQEGGAPQASSQGAALQAGGVPQASSQGAALQAGGTPQASSRGAVLQAGGALQASSQGAAHLGRLAASAHSSCTMARCVAGQGRTTSHACRPCGHCLMCWK
jgi:hypothetical protein